MNTIIQILGEPVDMSGRQLGQVLQACCRLGHTLSKSYLAGAVTLLQRQARVMSLAELSLLLWGLGKYRVKLVDQLQLQQQKKEEKLVQSMTGKAPSAPVYAAWGPVLARISAEGKKTAGGFQGLGLSSTCLLIEALADFQIKPQAAWMDVCLDALAPEFRSLTLQEMSTLMSALAKMGFAPARDWCLKVLGPAAKPQLLRASSSSVARFMELMALAGVQASPQWCEDALGCFRSGEKLRGCTSAACALAALPTILGFSHIPEFVANSLHILERLVLGLGPHLKNASPEELTLMISGCAALRFYPGRRFLRWHESACNRYGRTFSTNLLVQIRAAYISLRYSPDRQIYGIMQPLLLLEF
eukprot:gene10003-7887_t